MALNLIWRSLCLLSAFLHTDGLVDGFSVLTDPGHGAALQRSERGECAISFFLPIVWLYISQKY